MRAAVEDVHHRHRQQVRIDAADVAIERQAPRIGRCLRRRQADAQDRIGAEPALVLAAIERDHRGVDFDLVLGVEPDDLFRDVAVDRLNRLADALAAPAALVAVAQFDGLVSAGRCARRHGRAAHASVLQRDVYFDRRIAAAVEDLAGVDVDDQGHGFLSCANVMILMGELGV